MITFKFDSNSKQINAKLANLAMRQIPFAASKALNQTAVELEKLNRMQMKRRFDKPVRYTLNAFRVDYSNKRKLVAGVRRKDKPAGKHYFEVEAKGGTRPYKAIEKMASGITGGNKFIIPTSQGRGKMKNGAINAGEVTRAMSAIGASPSSNPFSRRRQDRAAKTRAGQKNPSQYFVTPAGTGKNKSGGIYKRTPAGRKVTKIFHIIEPKPIYEKRLPFNSYMMKQAKLSFPKYLRREMRAALRTAKFR